MTGSLGEAARVRWPKKPVVLDANGEQTGGMADGFAGWLASPRVDGEPFLWTGSRLLTLPGSAVPPPPPAVLDALPETVALEGVLSGGGEGSSFWGGVTLAVLDSPSHGDGGLSEGHPDRLRRAIGSVAARAQEWTGGGAYPVRFVQHTLVRSPDHLESLRRGLGKTPLMIRDPGPTRGGRPLLYEMPPVTEGGKAKALEGAKTKAKPARDGQEPAEGADPAGDGQEPAEGADPAGDGQEGAWPVIDPARLDDYLDRGRSGG